MINLNNYTGSTSIYSFIRSISSDIHTISTTLTHFSNNFAYRTNNGDFINTFLNDYWDDTFVVDDEYNFFVNLRNTLDDWYTSVIDVTDPMSENNIDTFNSSVEALTNDTFIGDVQTIASDGNNFVTRLNQVTPNGHLYINTYPVSFFGISIPSKTVDINLSWYEPFRQTAFGWLRAFIYLAYLWLVIKALPSVLGSAGPYYEGRAPVDDVVINENGEVLSHTTRYRNGNGHITMRH